MQFEAFLTETGIDLTKAPPGVLSDFASWLRSKRGLGASSVRTTHAGASSYVEWRRGQGESIPLFVEATLPKIVKPRNRVVLRGRKVAEYLVALDKMEVPEPCLTALRVAPFSGLRLAELAALHRADVQRGDIEPGRNEWWRIYVRHAKGAKKRIVPLPPQAEVALRPYFDGYLPAHPGGQWLWPDNAALSGRLGRQTIQKWLMRMRPMLGVRVSPHVLRRTYCTMLVRDYKVPIETVSRWMGHESVAVTLDYYVAVDDEELVKDMDKHFGSRS